MYQPVYAIRIKCPSIIDKIRDWPAKQFYADISDKCFQLEEENRISFEDLVVFISNVLNENELKSYEQMSKQYSTKYDLLLKKEIRGRLSTGKGSRKKKKSIKDEMDRRPSSVISRPSAKEEMDRRTSLMSRPIHEDEVFIE